MHFLPKEPFVIISASRQGQTAEEAFVTNTNLKNLLTRLDYKFKTVYGKYHGETETSFYIPWISVDLALDIARQFDQESILVVLRTREAYLYYTDGDRPTPLGVFVKGTDDDNNYTIADGIKYVCKMPGKLTQANFA